MDREEWVFFAKMAEQAERYEEMVDAMKEVAKLHLPLTIEERNLLSVAYKNVIGARRASWRIMSSIEQKESNKGEERRVEMIVRCKEVVEGEIRGICEEAVGLLDTSLIPHELGFEGRTFYLKMKGDYNRYMAEFAAGGERKALAQRALDSYREAEVVSKNLPATHPIRLGLGLNFSVFYYEILNDPDRACQLSKGTFDAAIAELDNLSEEDYKDSTLIMQLMRDGLTLWTSDIPESEDGEQMGGYHA